MGEGEKHRQTQQFYTANYPPSWPESHSQDSKEVKRQAFKWADDELGNALWAEMLLNIMENILHVPH